MTSRSLMTHEGRLQEHWRATTGASGRTLDLQFRVEIMQLRDGVMQQIKAHCANVSCSQSLSCAVASSHDSEGLSIPIMNTCPYRGHWDLTMRPRPIACTGVLIQVWWMQVRHIEHDYRPLPSLSCKPHLTVKRP